MAIDGFGGLAGYDLAEVDDATGPIRERVYEIMKACLEPGSLLLPPLRAINALKELPLYGRAQSITTTRFDGHHPTDKIQRIYGPPGGLEIRQQHRRRSQRRIWGQELAPAGPSHPRGGATFPANGNLLHLIFNIKKHVDTSFLTHRSTLTTHFQHSEAR
jgi:hypothetical protein